KVFALVLLGLLLLSGAVHVGQLLGTVLAVGGEGTRSGGPRLIETVLEEERSAHKIAVLEVEGIISTFLLDGGGHSLVEVLEHQLKRAAADRAVKAVILEVNSPGGEVLAADEINRVIDRFQEESGKPVVAAMASVAASGGYYVAAPCRWIVANELTITGSIGVIMHGYNYRGLMDKLGLQPNVYKSGKFKDMLSGDRSPEEIPPEEGQMVQGLIDETFARFKEVVAAGRGQAAERNGAAGRRLVEDWEDYADGRVLSGKRAYELGFVDELGNFKVAVARAKQLAGVAQANLVRYQVPFELSSLFRLFGQSESRTLRLDWGVERPPLRVGQLYYLFYPGLL
ncbi:MAG: signal peptide peptidase SppA, partial [Verrucomicrobia bacterium]|nr:signal peptide peptidase SppA [Verrucomicrobiota bacterium]